jgi:uncharacterized protein (UPF0128 family)
MTEQQQGPIDQSPPTDMELLQENPEAFMATVTTREQALKLIETAKAVGLRIEMKNERGQFLDTSKMSDQNLILAVKEGVRWALNRTKSKK